MYVKTDCRLDGMAMVEVEGGASLTAKGGK